MIKKRILFFIRLFGWFFLRTQKFHTKVFDSSKYNIPLQCTALIEITSLAQKNTYCAFHTNKYCNFLNNTTIKRSLKHIQSEILHQTCFETRDPFDSMIIRRKWIPFVNWSKSHVDGNRPLFMHRINISLRPYSHVVLPIQIQIFFLVIYYI